MNSYFASVEQQANPHLRGRAVGVVATMTPNGCVIASSIEAKAKGIKTGVRVQDARRLDPDVILIPNDSAKYRSCTEGIWRVLRRYSEDIEPYSIDEAFLNLTGFVHNFTQATAMAEKIRGEIQGQVGEWLKCSIGIAPTRWLAKFAGDTAPKGQTLIVEPRNFPQTIDPRPLTDAWGIASRMERRLNALNLYSLGDLRHYPVTNLMQIFGMMGYVLWANVNGLEIPGYRTLEHPKSIGHSHVFARRAQNLDYAKAVLAKLCEKAGRRLRRLNLEAYGVWLAYGLPDHPATPPHTRRGHMEGGQPGWGGSGGRKLAYPLFDTRDIFRHCWQILMTDLPPGQLPRFLAMTLFNLKPRVSQGEIWPRGKHDSPTLARALDDLNDKYGDFTVARGNFWGLTDRDAPDRVGFRKTVSYDPATGQYRW